jgi:SsrA-binding protein
MLYCISNKPKGGSPVSPKAKGVKSIAQNRKAYHDYFIDEKFEAGIELFGTEVKSIRMGNVSLKDSFCSVKDGELFAYGIHISPYEKGNIFNRDPLRPKRLLMHKKEINRLAIKIKQDGLTLIPLSVYLKDSLVKVELGLARGKKLYDKRESSAKRDAEREMDRTIKERNR